MSNSLILGCSASEGGGTARFASGLIDEREIIRQTVTQSTSTEGAFLQREVERGFSYGEDHRVEDAVMASEIEALPDRAGFVKFASRPAWSFVAFDYFDLDKRAEPFEPVLLGSGGAGGGARWSADPMPAAPGPAARGKPGRASDSSTFASRAELEATRNGDQPIPESIAEVLLVGDMTIDEFVEICQSAVEDVAGKSATTLAAVMRDMKDGRGATDYVEMIKRMAAQGREPPGVERG